MCVDHLFHVSTMDISTRNYNLTVTDFTISFSSPPGDSSSTIMQLGNRSPIWGNHWTVFCVSDQELNPRKNSFWHLPTTMRCCSLGWHPGFSGENWACNTLL
jgi:hypothetical protein